ncbi:MAG: hypothetical protein ACF8LK_00690 [Phycisphaerales bacterium JB041]
MTIRDTDALWTINPTGQDCLALAAAIAATSVAYAGPVRYDNDANYSWFYSVLDITKSSADQTYGGVGDVTGTSFYMDYFADFYPTFSYNHHYLSGNGGSIWSAGFNNFYAAPHNRGDLIGPDLGGGAWNQGSNFEFAWTACERYYYNYQYYYGDCYSGYRGLLPPDGSPTYVGARITIDNQFHYGWIGVTNTRGYIDVFAWGYETQPGVAVAAGAPTPGALGVLAVGAAGALSRRKRPA